REIGVDTQNYGKALGNALREAPDLIMIGEVRDRETMQQALLHTLTGHLCLSTIHSNNSYHALSRIINMFPYDARSGLLSDLSIGLRAIISQRLVRNKEGDQQPAVEILLNTSLIAELIKNGEITQIKEAMEQSLYPGSQTFEQALCRLHLECELVARRSQTPDDAGCQEILKTRLTRAGFRCETLVSNGVTNLWARRGTVRPAVCFAGHTDVVPTGPLDAWTSDAFAPTV